MRSARFCFLTTFYPPYSFGGDGIAVERLAKALAGRGADVTVVHDVDSYNALHDGPEPANNREDLPGLHVVPLRSRLGAIAPLLTQQFGRPVVHGRRLRQLLNVQPFDVVVFHNISLVGGPAVLAYGGDAVKIYMAHDHWLVCPTHVLWRHDRELCTSRECLRCVLRHRRPPQVWRSTGFLNRYLDQVDTFIAMSRFSRDKHREFGFPRDMDVLPPFLEPAHESSSAPPSASPHERPYFMAVGRLERMKGFDGLVQAFARYPNADLVIAGEGGHEGVLHDLARGNSRIRFLGRVNSATLDRYYRHALALVVPSVCYETFGITVIEAFRQGTPVIARHLGPFPELLGDPDLGTLFRTDEELLDAMGRMQNDPAWRQARSEASARAFSQRWAEDVVVPRFLELVQTAADRKRHARSAQVAVDRARA